MYVSNSRESDYTKDPEVIKWNLLPYLLSKKAQVKAVGKYELHKFYSEYRKFKPDLILTTWVPAGFIPIFLKKLGLVKCPIIHRWEDYYVESMTNYPASIVAFMRDYTTKNADYLITVLKTLKDRAEKMNRPIFFLPYGYTAGNKKSKINLDKLKTKKNNVKVIYAGDLASKFKRVDKIITAAKKAECDLFLFGGKADPDLLNLAKGHKNIHFMGWADPQELNSILQQGDILVNTANHDICMKFLDYIRAGKPILGLNDRPANFFKHKETAYLTDDFGQALIDLIKDKPLREKIEANMKKIKQYSWEEVADIHLKLYDAVLRKKPLQQFETSYYHTTG